MKKSPSRFAGLFFAFFLLLAPSCVKKGGGPSGDGQGISGYSPSDPVRGLVTIEKVEPPIVEAKKGIQMTISGSNFEANAEVLIAGVICKDVVLVNDAKLLCSMADDVTAPGEVIVKNPSGSSGSLPPPPSGAGGSGESGSGGWNGTGPIQWVNVDASQLNVGMASSADAPHLVAFQSKMYAAWAEAGKIQVAVYSGSDANPDWKRVTGNTVGINFNPAEKAKNPQLVVVGSRLFALWVEESAGKNRLRAAIFNGQEDAAEWSFVDGATAAGISPTDGTVVQNAGEFARFTVVNDTLYGVYWDTAPSRSLHVISFTEDTSGARWERVNGFGTSALNAQDLSSGGHSPDLVGRDGMLYVTWIVPGAFGSVVRAAAWRTGTSPSWKYVDSPYKRISRSSDNQSASPRFAVVSNKIYIIFTETANGKQAQVRVARLNSGGSWTYIAGLGASGLNYGSSTAAFNPQLISFGGKLLAQWQEDGKIHLVSPNSLTVDTPTWVRLDSIGLNRDMSLSARAAYFGLFDGKLYGVWREEDGAGQGMLRAVAAH